MERLANLLQQSQWWEVRVPRKQIHLKPQAAGGDVHAVKVGPKWTYVTVKLATDRLQIQTSRAKGKTA